MQTQALRIPVSILLLGLGTACGHAAAPSPDPSDVTAGTGGEASSADSTLQAQNPQSAVGDQQLAAGGAPAGDGFVAGASGNSADASAEPDVGSAADIISPRIVSLTPEDGAVGVTSDAGIVIEFSEPMAKASTVDAFTSESLPREELSTSWNDAGTVLTIKPTHGLDYAHATLNGAEALELEAKRYRYTLTRAASDLAGNPLTETSVTFSTLRDVTQSVQAVPSMTGVLRGQGHDAASYGFVTFDMQQLPSDIRALQSAIAHGEQPYQALRAIPIVDVEFDELSPAAITAGPGTLISTLPAGASGDQVVPESAVPFLVSDYQRRSALHRYSQFRLVLPNGLSDADVLAASSLLAQTSVVLRYLLP